MAAPTPVAFGTPAGRKLKDGFRFKMSFGRLPNVGLWSKGGKPPKLSVGGDKIKQTTHHNVRYHTAAARALLELGDATMKCAFDPAAYTSIVNDLLGQNGTITQLFSDGSTLSYYGYIAEFEIGELQEGSQAEATVTVHVTNVDPSDDSEAGPVLTSVSGT